MKEIKSINIFTQGDSTEPSTWSNVPFCFTNALESSGIQVNRINILPDPTYIFKLYKKIWTRFINKFICIFYENHIYNIDRSIIYRMFVNSKIKRAIEFYPAADYNIFLTFSYTNKFSSGPSLLLCDYTYEIYIKNSLKRKPNLIEQAYIRYENKVIARSEVVVNLFANYATLMTSKYHKKVHYLGNMGINIVYQEPLVKLDTLPVKVKSNKILFIGNRWNHSYIIAAKLLIESFSLLKALYPQIELHFIGMSNDSFENIPTGVYCHGYLDKRNKEQRKEYYDLLLNAKLFVNTSGSYGATMEAMYYYTPIVTARYGEIVEEFGQEIQFGQYCNELSKEKLLQCIVTVLESDKYTDMCVSAHDIIAPHTWEEFSKKIIKLLGCHLPGQIHSGLNNSEK